MLDHTKLNKNTILLMKDVTPNYILINENVWKKHLPHIPYVACKIISFDSESVCVDVPGTNYYTISIDQISSYVNPPKFGAVFYMVGKAQVVKSIPPLSISHVNDKIQEFTDLETIGLTINGSYKRVMYGHINEENARRSAKSLNTLYGHSIFCHPLSHEIRWFTGSIEELNDVGVYNPINPKV